MKNLLLAISFIIPSISQANIATDASQLQPIGRSIENRSTGEKIDLACLEIPAEGKSCLHFQLRYTDQTGNVSLVGSEVMMKTMPEEAFTKEVMDSNKTFYQQKKWGYAKAFPIIMSILHNGYDEPNAYGGGVLLGGVSVIVASLLTKNFGTGLIVGASVAAAIPAVDLLITVAPLLAVGIQRGLLTIPKHAQTIKLKKAMHSIFDGAETTDTSFRINNNRFNFLKTNLTNYMN